jgi:hypothetical protein
MGTAVASADLVDFQPLTGGGVGATHPGSTYSQSGYTFTALSSVFAAWNTGNANYAGSTALYNDNPNRTTRLTADSAIPFNLVSMDAAEVYRGTGQSVTITFTGTKADTSTVSQAFTLDGNHNGTLASFETLNFNSGFTNLVKVEWNQTPQYHQIDNVVINPIPAPGAAMLGIVGMTVIGALRRRLG